MDAESYIIHHYDELKDIENDLIPKLTEMIEDAKNLSREGLLKKYQLQDYKSQYKLMTELEEMKKYAESSQQQMDYYVDLSDKLNCYERMKEEGIVIIPQGKEI